MCQNYYFLFLQCDFLLFLITTYIQFLICGITDLNKSLRIVIIRFIKTVFRFVAYRHPIHSPKYQDVYLIILKDLFQCLWYKANNIYTYIVGILNFRDVLISFIIKIVMNMSIKMQNISIITIPFNHRIMAANNLYSVIINHFYIRNIHKILFTSWIFQ